MYKELSGCSIGSRDSVLSVSIWLRSRCLTPVFFLSKQKYSLDVYHLPGSVFLKSSVSLQIRCFMYTVIFELSLEDASLLNRNALGLTF